MVFSDLIHEACHFLEDLFFNREFFILEQDTEKRDDYIKTKFISALYETGVNIIKKLSLAEKISESSSLNDLISIIHQISNEDKITACYKGFNSYILDQDIEGINDDYDNEYDFRTINNNTNYSSINEVIEKLANHCNSLKEKYAVSSAIFLERLSYFFYGKKAFGSVYFMETIAVTFELIAMRIEREEFEIFAPMIDFVNFEIFSTIAPSKNQHIQENCIPLFDIENQQCLQPHYALINNKCIIDFLYNEIV